LRVINAIAGEEGQKVNFVVQSTFSFSSINLTEETFNFSKDLKAFIKFQVGYN
jgi:hypothetical protein